MFINNNVYFHFEEMVQQEGKSFNTKLDEPRIPRAVIQIIVSLLTILKISGLPFFLNFWGTKYFRVNGPVRRSSHHCKQSHSQYLSLNYQKRKYCESKVVSSGRFRPDLQTLPAVDGLCDPPFPRFHPVSISPFNVCSISSTCSKMQQEKKQKRESLK